jgi:hypothetical protein
MIEEIHATADGHHAGAAIGVQVQFDEHSGQAMYRPSQQIHASSIKVQVQFVVDVQVQR